MYNETELLLSCTFLYKIQNLMLSDDWKQAQVKSESAYHAASVYRFAVYTGAKSTLIHSCVQTQIETKIWYHPVSLDSCKQHSKMEQFRYGFYWIWIRINGAFGIGMRKVANQFDYWRSNKESDYCIARNSWRLKLLWMGHHQTIIALLLQITLYMLVRFHWLNPLWMGSDPRKQQKT